ncbi:transposase IS4 [Alkalihalobacillus alcalophilus ATCC 27647 = CGMCC 1.3604]|uniref:Transposase n=1 Tax=Alkalihalobacillus alcalophilus ATCC 27647 = CGMCC 1.3604 TaxID=1218173 RepID=A0A094WSN7_ALKAL|nr:IS1182 family transposase [Alkalihalobacillus alcalophilus]KGA99093.1 transposase [Alkalihalobacillus alcalophilus ATCC 27647 = CGMCC 1.3604]MED1561798.1 IS1182 family transposase [Alkalihalobacillus alcalophilus]THG88399.1 transposase IS4 [Alkalihalobacillus alcalophilus ATCC 27647 = CGMCC 1.3604]
MIEQQSSLILSPYIDLYEKLIDPDHPLRRIKELVDFSFIDELFKGAYCLDNGRNGVPPIRMFKYLLLKEFYSLADRDLVARSKTDLAIKFFLDLAPEDDVIDPSLLSKFRKQRIKPIEEEMNEGKEEKEKGNLLTILIAKTVEIAEQHQIRMSSTVIVDSTHSSSRYHSMTAGRFIKEKAKLVRKSVYQFDESMKEKFPQKPKSDDGKEWCAYSKTLIETIEQEAKLEPIPAIQEKVNYLKEIVEDYQEGTVPSNDPDARVGYKSQDQSFFGYKTHTAMTTDRLITAAIVTTGEKADGRYLQDLVNQTRAAGVEIDTVIGDTAYSGKDNLQFAKEEGKIDLVSKLHPIITQHPNAQKGFVFNKDADMFACPAGHLAFKKKIDNRGQKENKNPQMKYFFDVEICQSCPMQEGCYKGTKTKTYSVTIKSPEHREQEHFQNSEVFQALARDRYMIEAKFGEMKNRHGFKKAKNSGLFGMSLQTAMTIFVVNLKRIMKLIDEKEQN